MEVTDRPTIEKIINQEQKEVITEFITNAVASPLSYPDYRNFIKSVQAGGIAGAKLRNKILEDNPYALVCIPPNVELLEFACRTGAEKAGIRLDSRKMEETIAHEQEHVQDAVSEGASEEDLEFGLLFMRYPKSGGRWITTFILMTLVGGISEEKERKIAQRSLNPSASDEIVAHRAPEIIISYHLVKNPVVKPKEVIEINEKNT